MQVRERCGTLAKIYLSYNNQAEVIELPVLPEKLEISEKGNNKTNTLQNIGEVTVINPTSPSKVKLQSFFPLHYAPYVSSMLLLKPKEYVETIQKWRSSGKPIRLTIANTAMPMSMACSIENFVYQEVAGAVGDIGYTLELKEYRWYKVKKAIVSQSEENKTELKKERPVEKETLKQYIVKEGDTLYAICKAQLGDGNKYKEVAAKNKIANPNLIKVGQVINL